jgi:hypothetical protein
MLPEFFTCAVGIVPGGQLCSAPLVLPGLVTDGTRCEAVAIRGGQQQRFRDRLEVDGMKFEIALGTGCTITVRPSGTPAAPKPVQGLFAVDLENGRGLASPIVFELVPTTSCGSAPVTCVNANAATWPASCTGAPMPTPWGPPALVQGLVTSGGNDDPTLRGDLLEIYFNNAADDSIFHSVRTSLFAPWSPPELVSEVGTGVITSTPHITHDGLALYFNSTRSGGPGGADIFVTKRTNANATSWLPPTRIPELATMFNDYGASTDLDQRHMIFNSDRDGTGYELYEVTRPSGAGLWSANATHLTSLGSQGDEINPHLSPDGLTVYFSSTRSSGTGADLYVATRPSLTAPFAAPLRIDELSTASNDVDPWVSQDGRTIFFASDRAGTYQIYEAHR